MAPVPQLHDQSQFFGLQLSPPPPHHDAAGSSSQPHARLLQPTQQFSFDDVTAAAAAITSDPKSLTVAVLENETIVEDRIIMDVTRSHNEAHKMSSGTKRGGWISFPFIIGTLAGLSLASAGIWSNLIVYLIQEFHIKSISAAQIFNVVNGSTSLFPFVGAILADTLFGSFPVVLLSSLVSLLGTIVFALTATIKSLRPQPYIMGSNMCKPPSTLQYTVLYLGTALAVIGFGGARFTTATLGANQFDKAEEQNTFFNWFFFTMYFVSVIGATGLVYIEDNVSWGVGFGICLVSNFIALIIFLLGYRFYRPDSPKGSVFLDLARVPVASLRKWRSTSSQLSSTTLDYYVARDGPVVLPGKRFRFFNRAAQITNGDLQPDGKILKPWKLCTVQQVEDFKTVIGILPLWTSSIFLATPIGMQTSVSVLQALVMDRHLGQHFQIPAGSINVILILSTSIFLTLLDRVLWPLWQKLFGKSPTPLQRIGVGHVFNVLGMVVSAIVESKRLKIAHNNIAHNNHNVAMSVMWLFPQLVLVGIGEAFHFPGQVALYYQQLPQSLRSTSTAMISMIIAIAFYLSAALIDQVRRSTDWLPDDINHGRMDNVYWILVLLGGINFVYYILCATFYRYKKV